MIGILKRPWQAVVAGALLAASAPAMADDAPAESTGQQAAACLTAAAHHARMPAGVLLVLLRIEGGRIGTVSANSNGTSDLGPMQVNTTWVGRMAERWHTTPDRAYAALRDNVCANLEAGSWILGQALIESHGDLWQAVSFYHSHTPRFGIAYLRRFYAMSQTMMQGGPRAAQPGDPA